VGEELAVVKPFQQRHCQRHRRVLAIRATTGPDEATMERDAAARPIPSDDRGRQSAADDDGGIVDAIYQQTAAHGVHTGRRAEPVVSLPNAAQLPCDNV
jgi:hypothetical protein